ncbi:hypothetical protein [Psychrobacter phenylpyruvicus]|uniref:Uncharacterized protein n=1 Tax=Psychrobacter phenylpyruvicus TaxID=29432 RepID=A0A379LNP6_9GAMM|nr:hypothetical protein [Psychrobacter phenylpyruvicus]SUD92173.1 Uncharacterised protein [Psychrobacter phenylpyruvicus]
MQNRTKKNIYEEIWEENEKGLLLPKNLILERGDNKKEKRSLVDYIKWGINHISVLVLFPSIVGAIWQIIELAKINIAYIRFFSLSQIPVDGALIIALSGILILGSKLTIEFVNFSFKERAKILKNKEFINTIKPKINRLILKHTLLSLLLLCGFVYMLVVLYADMFLKGPIFTILLVYVSFAGIMIYTSDIVILVSVKKTMPPDWLNRCSNNLLKKCRKIFTWSVFPIVGLIIYMIFSLLNFFSKSFVLPGDLYNTKNLDSVVYSDFHTDEYNIEYFNDKYIFLKLCTVDNCDHHLDEKIVIYPMEKVLFDKHYNNLLSPSNN